MRAAGKKDSVMYQALCEIDGRLHHDEESIAVIKEAREAFPESATFRNLEINYYIGTGQSAVLLDKLENAAKADPSNPELLFNLANSYEKAAFPKNADGTALPKPSTFETYFNKAANTYAEAIKLRPNEADYYYNFGVLYYENAAGIIKDIQSLGTTAADNAKYDALSAALKVQFQNAQPYF